jgi:hypothetical protein
MSETRAGCLRLSKKSAAPAIVLIVASLVAIPEGDLLLPLSLPFWLSLFLPLPLLLLKVLAVILSEVWRSLRQT